jgi:hypothetical protein
MEVTFGGRVSRGSYSRLFIKLIFKLMTEIEIDSVSKRFEKHLKVEQNYRIILSGKFGVGKTFFLKKFFEERKDVYNPIFIYPVNYVVSSTENIFELIKVDIIKQLFTRKTSKKKNSISTPEKIALFASEKPHHFLKFITSTLKKINPFVEIADNIYDSISRLYTEYKEYEKALEGKFELPEDQLEKFTDFFQDKVGNLFEEDFITKTLKAELIKRKQNGKKKNVLVIDDLDRIDPEHIFRILNILSAHNNDFDSKNKFEFDHIIIVCDNDNIRKIFHHKYGHDVDFEGYIDKFYSTEIFYYKNDEAIKFYLESIFEIDKEYPGFIELVIFIFNRLVNEKKITVRQIIKHLYKVDIAVFTLFEQVGIEERNISLNSRPAFIVDLKQRLFVDSNDLQILKMFKLMSIIYGDFNEFYKNICELTKSNMTNDAHALKQLLAFLALQNHIASNVGDKLFFHLVYGNNYRLERALTELYPPHFQFLSKDYNIKLHWSHSFPYNGQTSYFFNSQAVSSDDDHQHVGAKSKRPINESEIFMNIKSIILNCQHIGYLFNAGIILNSKM